MSLFYLVRVLVVQQLQLHKNMRKLFTKIIIMHLFFVVSPIAVFAGGAVDFNKDFTTDDKIGLDTISIPFFPQLGISSEYSTTLSWVGFVGTLLTIGIVGFWIVYVVRQGVKAMTAETNADQLAESQKKIVRVLTSMAITFFFPAAISIVGAIIGAGPIWEWPLAFRECNYKDYSYYYQAIADEDINSREEADAVCF